MRVFEGGAIGRGLGNEGGTGGISVYLRRVATELASCFLSTSTLLGEAIKHTASRGLSKPESESSSTLFLDPTLSKTVRKHVCCLSLKSMYFITTV